MTVRIKIFEIGGISNACGTLNTYTCTCTFLKRQPASELGTGFFALKWNGDLHLFFPWTYTLPKLPPGSGFSLPIDEALATMKPFGKRHSRV